MRISFRFCSQGVATTAARAPCFVKPPVAASAALGGKPSTQPFEGLASSKVFVDLYGQKMTGVGNEQIDCPNCKRKVVASRYAPHLEKCMGKSRRTRRQGDSNAMSNSIGASHGTSCNVDKGTLRRWLMRDLCACRPISILQQYS